MSPGHIRRLNCIAGLFFNIYCVKMKGPNKLFQLKKTEMAAQFKRYFLESHTLLPITNISFVREYCSSSDC